MIARIMNDSEFRHAVLREMRPRQWTKNVVVLAASFFALGDRVQAVPGDSLVRSLLAAFCFCLVSSGIYIFNDMCDIELDRAHPVKKHRPLASGEIGMGAARVLSVSLLCAGLLFACLLSLPLAGVMLTYVLIQAAYTGFLKSLALIDVFVISTGFVLRAMAGGIAANVSISFWLLICTFLMALFLGLCKRRHEKKLMDTGGGESRPSLKNSDRRLLDQLIAITASAVIVSYAVYTQWPETVAKFGTHRLGLTIPFVVFGVFRYLDLVYRHSKGDQPEYVLLTDIPLIVDIVLYGLCVFAVFYM